MNIYDGILEEEKRRGVINYEKMVPNYIISTGCHLFNLVNREKKLYTESGSIALTRLHVLFLTFPGFGKTFIQKQFIDDESFSFLKGSSINCKFEGDMTNAGFVGSIKYNELSGQTQVIKGLCEERSSSILGIDEFSSVTNAFKQQYNTGFDTNLLKALDTGDVELRRGPGSHRYHTDFTLWAGVQPARFDIGSGFFRRFIFMVYIPTVKDIIKLKYADNVNIRVDYNVLSKIRDLVNNRAVEMNNKLKKISFNKDFMSEIRNLSTFHTDQQLFMRMGIGYWVTKTESMDSELVIGMDNELRRLITLQKQYRRETRSMTPYRILWGLIKDEETVGYNQILDIWLELGLEAQTFAITIQNLKKQGKITVNNGVIYINEEKKEATVLE